MFAFETAPDYGPVSRLTQDKVTASHRQSTSPGEGFSLVASRPASGPTPRNKTTAQQGSGGPRLGRGRCHGRRAVHRRRVRWRPAVDGGERHLPAVPGLG